MVEHLSVEGRLELPSVQRYFETFNRNAFAETAALFAPEGQLCPPFGNAIAGRDAIASYLSEEATSITALPRRYVSEQPQAQTVTGLAKTSAFQVPVQWRFQLTQEGQIKQVSIRLLASLKELLALRSFQ